MTEKEAIEMLYTLVEKNVLPSHYDGSYEEAFDIVINLIEQKDNKINKVKNKLREVQDYNLNWKDEMVFKFVMEILEE